jgi:formylglycine-generating enzyme required for sulfatase activity
VGRLDRFPWDDITKEYLPWVLGKTGKTYRLLTEPEWEYAARAGTTTRYAFGETITQSQVAYSQRVVNVGSFQPNAFGLHDMHGNVWEWVQDSRNDNYQRASNDGSAWITPDCSRRVLRGGSTLTDPIYLRSAARSGLTPDSQNGDVGFRLARTLNP